MGSERLISDPETDLCNGLCERPVLAEGCHWGLHGRGLDGRSRH